MTDSWGPSVAEASAGKPVNKKLTMHAAPWFQELPYVSNDSSVEVKDDALRTLEKRLEELFPDARLRSTLDQRVEAYAREQRKHDVRATEMQQGIRGGRGVTQQHQSATVTPTIILDEVKLSTLAQERLGKLAVREIDVIGRPQMFNDALSKASHDTPIPLKKEDDVKYVRGDIMDPVVDEFINAAEEKHPLVVISDDVLAHLMASTSSVNPWDVEIVVAPPDENTREMIKFGRRDAEADDNVGRYFVNETAPADEVPLHENQEESNNMDSRDRLAAEAAAVNNIFRRMCTSKSALNIKTSPIPKSSDEDGYTYTRNTLYTYKLYTINPEDPEKKFDVLVRTEVDTASKTEKGDIKKFICVAIMQFFNTKLKWQSKKQLQWSKTMPLGTLLSQEYNRNKFTISRWVYMAHLADAELKVGFIGRNTEGSISHSLVGVHTVNPMDLEPQLGISYDKAWSAFAAIVNKVREIVKTAGDDSVKLPSGIAKLDLTEQLTLFNEGEDGDEDDEDEDSNDSNDEDDDYDDE